ncbi:hypothetical protein MMC17_003407 [Xylographa soralifera]|nr:hypothetical protein [Xylographa soralifera]
MANSLPTIDPVQNTMPRIVSTFQSSHKPDLSSQHERTLPEAISNQPTPARSAVANEEPSVRPAYLSYEPKPFLHTDSKNHCYRTYLDRLGFNTWDDPIALEARLQFIRDLKAHVCVPETTYLRKDDNPAAFNALIFGFVGKYGDRYWGMEREHLAEKDPLKGFLYPRDALRENSRLISVLEDIFIYKAKCSRNNDWNRPLERQVVTRINFAALSPQDINSIGKESADINIEGSLRELERFRKQEMERTSDTLSEQAQTGSGADVLNGTSGTDSSSSQPQRRIQPPRSIRSGLYPDTAQIFHATGEAVIESLQATKPKQKQATASEGEHLVVTPLHTTNRSATKLTDVRTPSTISNDIYRRSSISHSVKRQDPLEAIENVRKRTRLEHNGTAPQTTPPVTTWNTRTKNAKGLSHGAPGLFTSSMAGNGGRRPNRRLTAAEHAHQDDAVIALSDEPESAEITHQSSRNTGLNTPISNKFEAEVKIKAEQLSNEIMSKTTLLVTATNLQDMAPVTVKLECYKGFSSFLDFLSEECVLGDLSNKVTDASATYTWNGRKHRFRKERLDVDWQAFCNELRDAFQKNPTFIKLGCEVGMLLHVTA